MPTAPLTYCRHPGCTSRVQGGYCSSHAPKPRLASPKAPDDPAQQAAIKFRDSAAWKRLRLVAGAQNPICCDPFKDPSHPAPTEGIHHIIPLHERLDLGLDPANLAALCNSCHAAVEAMNRRGQQTRHLFAGKTCKVIL